MWMMRQAGRYQKVYQELCKKHPTFRERSENADLAVEISLQPYRAFRPDGVILFSDILTPLPAMNIAFDLPPGKGPVILNPIRTAAQVREVTTGDDFTFRETNHYVGEALTRLRQEVGDEATVLGFAGCPYTLATYIIEGGSSKNFTHIKRMMLAEPATLHALLDKLATNVADYVRYQADAGARVVQIFDSWAAHLMPQDFDEFCAPYNKVRGAGLVWWRHMRWGTMSWGWVRVLGALEESGRVLIRCFFISINIPYFDWVALDTPPHPSPLTHPLSPAHHRRGPPHAPRPPHHPLHLRQRRPDRAHGPVRPGRAVDRPLGGPGGRHPAWGQPVRLPGEPRPGHPVRGEGEGVSGVGLVTAVWNANGAVRCVS